MKNLIRKMERKDCEEVAHVVTIAWNESYRGIVPDDFLDNLYKNEKERSKNLFDNFDENQNHQYVLEVDNKIVGFINVNSSDENEFDNCGEIHALYIINGYKGHGFGKKLVEAGKKELKNMGYDKMVIGCLNGNESNDFYTHIGGQLIKTRIFEKLQLPENVYYFDII